MVMKAVTAFIGGTSRLSERTEAGRKLHLLRLYSWEAPNNAVWSAAAEVVEGRRSIGGKVRGNACPGHSAGSGMSLKQRAYASELDWAAKPRMPIASDLR